MRSTHDNGRTSLVHLWQSVVAVSGALLIVAGVGALVTAVVAFSWYGAESKAIHLGVFGIALVASAGAVWQLTPRPVTNHLAVNSAAVAVGWVVATFVCSAPFLSVAYATDAPNATIAEYRHLVNSWYESTSSLSSSGLTVAAQSSEIPRALQL